MNRRIIINVITFAFISAVFSNSLHSEYNTRSINANLNASETPDHITLTWMDDPETTQTITWRTASTVRDGFVEYGEAGAIPARKMKAGARIEPFATIWKDQPGRMNIFSVTLRELKPGTRYFYRVSGAAKSSPRYYFATAAANPDTVEFLIFGDSQSGNIGNPDYAQWHATLTNAIRLNRNSKFIVTMGDMVEMGQDYIHWNNWFDAAGDALCRVPIVPVQGNHETYSIWKVSSYAPTYFLSQFKTFRNGPEKLKGHVYSFDYGPAHFAVLDSQQREGDLKSDTMLRVQAAWLDRDLAATGKKWKLVFFHKTPYSHNPMARHHRLKNAFCPIMDRHHVDVVFNGHDHVIARTRPMKNDRPYDDPKEGTVYYITGRSGKKFYHSPKALSVDAFFHNPTDQPCYEKVTVTGTSLRIVARKQDGTVIDDYSIRKD